MLEVTVYREKEGEIVTEDYNGKPITEENLAYVLWVFEANFDFTIDKIRKNGKTLTEEEIESIKATYPCEVDDLDKWDAYFHEEKRKHLRKKK